MNLSFRKFFKKTKVSPTTTNILILEIIEEYNREIYKNQVLKQSTKQKIKKNNYSF